MIHRAIAAEFAELRTLDPYTKPGSSNGLSDGANFASGGAGVVDEGISYGIVSDALQFNRIYIM